MCFNPHAREGRDDLQHCLTEARYRFNPHAREGRDLTTSIFPSLA